MNDEGRFLNLDTWYRRSAYRFFKDFEMPFFGVCAEVRVTRAKVWCKAEEESFALACWFLCKQAVNAVEEFRFRLRENGVWVHDRIRISTTVGNPDGSFRICHLPFGEDFRTFCEGAREVMDTSPPEDLDDRPEDDALIHGSSLPWIRFTGLKHARRLDPLDSVPKITFGKATAVGEEILMPVSVEAHHALVDGLQVAGFLDHLQQALDAPESVLAGGAQGSDG